MVGLILPRVYKNYSVQSSAYIFQPLDTLFPGSLDTMLQRCIQIR